jgi:1-acyl-sn-glycerol-3-phosphate acyltransferase
LHRIAAVNPTPKPKHPVRWFAYMASRLLLKLILALVARTQVLHRERSRLSGGWILAANHISHFDPPFLGVACLRKMDWMTSREFYAVPGLGLWMRAVDTFPVDRERPDRAAIRTALDRLAAGRVLGLFPEGGIRDGARSMLEGAPLRPGLGALAQMSGAPVVPCVILGSDQLYVPKMWLPFRRSRTWINFGEPLRCAGQGKAARAAFETAYLAAIQTLLAELRSHFDLANDVLPQSSSRRKGRV